MTEPEALDLHTVLTGPTTLTVRRLVPGPAQRVWAYLTQSDLRRQWLASGAMEMTPGTSFELTWRNDELTNPPGERPQGFPGVHSNDNRIIEVEPGRRLTFAFATYGEVTFELKPQGPDVLVTLTHRGIPPDRSFLLMLSASWHNHIDLLVARVAGQVPAEPYWEKMTRLLADYETRMVA